MNSITSITSSLRNLRNVFLVFAAVIAGLVFPAAAPFLRTLTPVIVAFLVYSSMVGVSFSRTGLSRSVAPITVVLVISYGLVPLVGGFWSAVFLSDGVSLGIGAMLAAPATAGSAIVWTRLAGGNEDISGLSTVISLVLAPIVTPVLVRFLSAETPSGVVSSIEWQLLFILLVAGGLLTFAPRGIGSDSTRNYSTALSIGVLIYASVGTMGLTPSLFILTRVGSIALVVLLTATIAGFVFIVFSGGSWEDLIAIVLSGSLKNLGIALLIVIATSSSIALATVIGYYISQQVLSALLVDGLSSRWDMVDSLIHDYSRS